jgi:hypothetical protein
VTVTHRPDWAPDEVDIDRPAASRMYDFFLGGYHNFAADRAAAGEAVKHMPELPVVLQENRAFLRRAVRFLLDAGIRQFIDLGSGIPTMENVHEIAHRADPGARVVYVDIDPVAVAHSRAMLADNPDAMVLRAPPPQRCGLADPDSAARRDRVPARPCSPVGASRRPARGYLRLSPGRCAGRASAVAAAR